jgi:hypothetical protein
MHLNIDRLEIDIFHADAEAAKNLCGDSAKIGWYWQTPDHSAVGIFASPIEALEDILATLKSGALPTS